MAKLKGQFFKISWWTFKTLSYHLTTNLLRRHYKKYTFSALWRKASGFSENQNKQLNALHEQTAEFLSDNDVAHIITTVSKG